MKFVLEKTNTYKIFKYNFSNLNDLYTYLKSNPKVNHDIFMKQSSIHNGADFAGESLEKSIEFLKGGYNINFDKFDIATRNVRYFGDRDIDSRKLVRGLQGGTYLSPLVAAGAPDCMIRYERDTNPKHITVYFHLGYSWITTPEQVFNRGIATINLIQSLEDKGYLVDLKVFDLSSCGDEYFYVNVNLKNIDESLNLTKCYYPFVAKEFNRRLLFRVLESTPVERNWGQGYGQPADIEKIKEFYKLKNKDLIVGSPIDVGITGEDIYDDTVTLFENLNLENEFDLSKIRQKVKSR